MRTRLKKWLLSPWIILCGMIVGAAIGIFNQNIAAILAPLGDVYLILLQMCILPLVISAVILSLSKLLQTGTATVYLKRLILVFGLGLLTVSVVSIGSGIIFAPGANLSSEAKAVLSVQINKAEPISADKPQTESSSQKFIAFVHKIIPSNIFSALAQGESLAVLFFCILLGVALGVMPPATARYFLSVLNAIYLACLRIISWIMYGLPLGLCFLFAGYISQLGGGILIALAKLIILVIGVSFLLMVIYSVIIWRQSRLGYFQALAALKTPLLISFSTSSSFATLPATLFSLQENLKLDKQTTNLVIPLGITLNQQGGVVQFALTALFVAQLYGHTLTTPELLLTVITVIFASIAASGVPGIASVSVFAMVLAPLGLPVAIGIILLAAIEPIVDPFLTMLSVYSNCAAATLVADKNSSCVSDEV